MALLILLPVWASGGGAARLRKVRGRPDQAERRDEAGCHSLAVVADGADV
jgi:hypothetical protein